MKNKSFIIYSLKRVIREKKNVYFIAILTMCVIVLIGALTFEKLYKKNLYNLSRNNIAFRRLLIAPNYNADNFGTMKDDYDYGYDKILSLSHVLDLHNMKYDFLVVQSNTFKSSKHDGTIELLYGGNGGMPKNIIGKTINKNDTGLAVCSKNFYPSSGSPNINEKNAFLDTEKLIGTSFTINDDIYKRIDGKLTTDETYEKEFKIVGVFDSSIAGETPGSCYVSGRDIIEIFNATRKELNPDTLYSRLVTVDDTSNIGEVASGIRELGFEVTGVQAYFDEDLGNAINLICMSIIGVVIVTIILLTIFYLKKKCIDNLYVIGVLKAIGYKNSDIKKIYNFQILFSILITYLIGVILFLGIIMFIKTYFYNYIIYNNYILNICFSSFALTLIILIIIPLIINYIFIGKVLKKDAVILLEGENNVIK